MPRLRRQARFIRHNWYPITIVYDATGCRLLQEFYMVGLGKKYMLSTLEYLEIQDTCKDYGEQKNGNCPNSTDTYPSTSESSGCGARTSVSTPPTLTRNNKLFLPS